MISAIDATFDASKRVGMILERDNPSRQVHRFGYIVPAKANSLSNDQFVAVLWDDGEYDLVERKDLRPMSQMNDNPQQHPVISFADEICDFAHRRGRLASRN
ncbi:MAG: hypothetical protein ABWY49_13695 [Rhizobium sp.]